MSVEIVRQHLSKYGLENRVMEFAQSSATVELAAVAVGTEPARIAKTLSFYGKDGECILIVTAGDQKIDNSKYKAQFSCKAKMMTADDALTATGHAVGGVCPFALPTGVRVYLDISLQRFETVYPAAGSASSAVRMSCEELKKASEALAWIDVCKTREG
ncbi:MAG: YbaK/EbsC family protein [Ruminococcaceae bacterium]|nr:YbaK/EbsC family protein [Oscillospiraceae bacterium]